MYSDSSITNSYATGNVTADANADVGGLAGDVEDSSITDSYATGNATVGADVDADVGALVGTLYDSSISNSYATGTPTATGSGTKVIGGLVAQYEWQPALKIVGKNYYVAADGTNGIGNANFGATGCAAGVCINGRQVGRTLRGGCGLRDAIWLFRECFLRRAGAAARALGAT